MADNVNIQQETKSASHSAVTLSEVKDMHIQADKLVNQIVKEFEDDLRLQAHMLAKEDDMVLSSHVKEALSVIRRGKERKWSHELLILLGGGLFGTFLAGFVTELSTATPRPFWIAVYVIMGFSGAALIFLGFMKQYSK